MAQRITLAQTQLQLAQSNPELHNLQAAYKRMYQALEVQNIDEILPAKAQPQPTDPGIENARALAGEILQAFPDQNHDAHIAAHTVMIMSPIVQASPSVYGMLVSHCMEHISFKARMMVQEETQAELEQVAQQSPAMAQQAQSMVTPQMIESRVSEVEAELIAAFMQSIQPQGQEQDPLVGIRQQELMIRASEVERQKC